ncbi:hypothetical protein Q4I28_000209, partial [Leishmania naiffi]
MSKPNQTIQAQVEDDALNGSLTDGNSVNTGGVDPSDGQPKNPLHSGSTTESTGHHNGSDVQKRQSNIIFRFTEWLIPYGGVVSNCFSLGSVTLGGGIISMPSSFAMSGIIMSVIYLV